MSKMEYIQILGRQRGKPLQVTVTRRVVKAQMKLPPKDTPTPADEKARFAAAGKRDRRRHRNERLVAAGGFQQ